jgi:hypothetical protein
LLIREIKRMSTRVLGRTLTFLIAAALAVGLYPLLNEQTMNPCAAVERRFLKLFVAGSDAGDILGAAVAKETMGVGGGRFAETVALQGKPGIAAGATCYGYYWHSIYDRKWLLNFGYLNFQKL